MKEKYGYDTSSINPNQPMLIYIDKRNNRKILLIPSLCRLTGMTDENR